MVTTWILGVLESVLSTVLGAFSFPAVPTAVHDATGVFATATGFVANTGYWIPWNLMGALIGVWIASFLVGGAFKLGRIVLSFLTAGGGSAA